MTCFSTSSQFQFAKILVSFSTFDFELLGTRYSHAEQNHILSLSSNILDSENCVKNNSIKFISFKLNLDILVLFCKIDILMQTLY